MSDSIHGQVLSKMDQQPVYGALIELTSDNQRFPLRKLITGRTGVFLFHMPDEDIYDQVRVRVVDRDSRQLATVRCSQGCGALTVAVDIEKAALPRQPGVGTAISPGVFETIRDAIVLSSVDAGPRLEALGGLYCSLPPVWNMPEFVAIAQGVLHGRGEDVQAFSAVLDDLESWNHQAFSYTRRALSLQEASHVLSHDFLDTVTAAAKSKTGPRVFSREALALSIAAAMRIGGDDAMRINRNIGIVLEQYCGLGPIASLFEAAEGVLAGGEQNLFLEQAQLFAPICETPVPPRPGTVPGTPGPFPCPGGPPWPPDSGEDGWLAPVDECVPEIVGTVRDSLDRMHTYSITDVSPSGACPGEMITITGSGFLFEGRSGVVNFPGIMRGSYVPSLTIEEWTDTTIRVDVPEGACDGILDLDIPGVDRIVVCGTEHELFVSAADSAEFIGGSTAVAYFRTSVAPDTCLEPGVAVELYWKVCNTETVILEIFDSHENLADDSDPIGDEIVLSEPGAHRTSGSYRVPTLSRNTVLTLRLRVLGPCGSDFEDTLISVRRARTLDIPDEFEPDSFENWFGNYSRGISVATLDPLPDERKSSLQRLLQAVDATEAAGERLGVRGSGCSYTNIVAPLGTPRMIDPDGMHRTSLDPNPTDDETKPSPPDEVVVVLELALREDLGDEHSVLSSDALAAYRDERNGRALTQLRDRLVHVEAGIKLERLVCQLQRHGLSMPTLGGGVPQSITGAVSTGTHGATIWLPPIADFIRAIHLVGAGGIQWWLEPQSNRITDPSVMRQLKREGRLDPCLRVRYNDNLFYAALVSFGTAGVFYSVIVETVDTQVFRATTSQPSWIEAQEFVRRTILDVGLPEFWFLEITMDAARRVRLSTLELIPSDTELGEPDPSLLPEIAEGIWRILIDLPRRLPLELARYIARRSLRALNPFRAHRIIREIRETIEMVAEILRFIGDLQRIAGTHHSGGELDGVIANALPNALNLIWRLGYRLGIGPSVVDEIQNIITETERPTGVFVRQNHAALNFDDHDRCPPDSEDLPVNVRLFENPISRLFRSSEYAVPASDILDFTNEILDVAERVRRESDALILQINVRFTQATKALVGMQQFPLSGHVELFTIKGMNGNARFDSLLRPVLDRFDAVPHWGQLHSPSTDYERLYGATIRHRGREVTKLEAWRDAIDELAMASRSHPNTFRHDFARGRGLLTDL